MLASQELREAVTHSRYSTSRSPWPVSGTISPAIVRVWSRSAWWPCAWAFSCFRGHADKPVGSAHPTRTHSRRVGIAHRGTGGDAPHNPRTSMLANRQMGLEWEGSGLPEAPSAPETLEESGLSLTFLNDMILRTLYIRGV